MILYFVKFGVLSFEFEIYISKLYIWSIEIWKITKLFFSLENYMTTLMYYFIQKAEIFVIFLIFSQQIYL